MSQTTSAQRESTSALHEFTSAPHELTSAPHELTSVPPESTSTDGAVSLSSDTFGLVLIEYNGTVGTVCDDILEINDNACRVVCRQLGYR